MLRLLLLFRASGGRRCDDWLSFALEAGLEPEIELFM